MQKYSYLLTKYNKYLIHLALYILLFCGLYLRLQKIPADWNLDYAKAYLTSYHIVKYHEFPLVGPYAEGTDFFYTPLLDYFLVIPMLISTNIFFLIGFVALLHGFSIIILYLIGSEFYENKLCGLLAALFYTFSTSEIFYSRGLTTYNLVSPFALISFYFFLKYLKNNKTITFLLAYILSFISTLFYYPFSLYTFIFAFEIFKKNKSIFNTLLITISFFLALVSLHLPMLNFPHGFNLTSRNQLNLIDLTSYLNIFFELVFFDSKTRFFGIMAFLFLLILNIINNKSFIKKNLQFFAFFFLNFISLVLINNNLCCESYYLPTFPLFLIFIGYLISNLLLSKNLNLKIITVVLTSILFYSLINNMNEMYFKHFEFVDKEKVVDRIIIDAELNSHFNYNVIFASPFYPDLFNSILWYFLEVKTGKKFVRLVNTKYKFAMDQNPEVLYVYWQNRLKSDTNKFLDSFAQYNKQSLISSNRNYKIYRLSKK